LCNCEPFANVNGDRHRPISTDAFCLPLPTKTGRPEFDAITEIFLNNQIIRDLLPVFTFERGKAASETDAGNDLTQIGVNVID
jgi:hypothetical protein